MICLGQSKIELPKTAQPHQITGKALRERTVMKQLFVVFFDRQGVMYRHSLPPNANVTAARYMQILRHFLRVLRHRPPPPEWSPSPPRSFYKRIMALHIGQKWKENWKKTSFQIFRGWDTRWTLFCASFMPSRTKEQRMVHARQCSRYLEGMHWLSGATTHWQFDLSVSNSVGQ